MFALRHSATRLVVASRSSTRTATAATRSLSTAAAALSVKDLLVHLTVVDPSGARKQITGLVGMLKETRFLL